MASKNNPGTFDCYANAQPDEPMFVLLGRDKHAPTLVWLWATMRELDSENPAVVAEARKCAVDMMAWAHEGGRKSVGLGQAALAAVLELITAVNAANRRLDESPNNAATDVDIVRSFMTRTDFEEPA